MKKHNDDEYFIRGRLLRALPFWFDLTFGVRQFMIVK